MLIVKRHQDQALNLGEKKMNGRDATRGIFLQALICLFEALQDNIWVSLALEPDLEAEKVDIAWYYPDSTRATQVKSSRRQINVPTARRWASDLEHSCEATSYELILIGPCSGELSKGKSYGRVKVPCPIPLDLQGLLEQSAHRLAVYLEWREKSAGRATTRENVVYSLVGRLMRYSASGTHVSRDDFERILGDWVRDALGEDERPSVEQLQILKGRISKLVDRAPYIKDLHIDHPEAVQWRGAGQRYMCELDKLLPGDNWEEQRANAPFHKPNERATQEDYQRGCDIVSGVLGSALLKLQEELGTT